MLWTEVAYLELGGVSRHLMAYDIWALYSCPYPTYARVGVTGRGLMTPTE